MRERTIILKTTINKDGSTRESLQILRDHLDEVKGIVEQQKVATVIITTTVEIR